MDRTKVTIAKQNVLDENDAEYWSRATIEEKLETIMYLKDIGFLISIDISNKA